MLLYAFTIKNVNYIEALLLKTNYTCSLDIEEPLVVDIRPLRSINNVFSTSTFA